MLNRPTDDVRDEEEIFEELERGEDLETARLREKRLFQLKQEMQELEQLRAFGHGAYEEIKSEKDLLNLTTKDTRCVIHFFHSEFKRCHVMDGKLKELASRHFRTKFAKINVMKAPFLVEKLKIQVLPCVLSFIDGIVVDRLVGFEELGGTETFETSQLENRLEKSCVILRSM